MKRILSLLVAYLITTTCMVAQDSNNNNESPKSIGLEYHQKKNINSIHRSPLRFDIGVYYHPSGNTIEISYDGEAEGEVYLYLNDMMVGYSADINTELSLPSYSGNYTIEIVSDTWTAYGYLQL